jgi:3-oxoadipate enol-lactonase
MAIWPIDGENGLFHLHTPPVAREGKTLVFFNALTGDTAMWEGTIAARVRAAGHGTLSFNYRGQAGSPYTPGTALDAALIIEDARRLLAGLNPARPLLVGLSIGGLFSAYAWLAGLGGLKAEGLVLVNTLRRDGPRLRWINDALVRCAEVGGLELFRDLYAPLLFGEAWQERNRASFLKPDAYLPLPRDSGIYNLLRHAGTASWELPYENLALPVLVMTGLQDRVFHDPDDVERLAARLPRARRLDMAAAGHLLPAELPDEFAAALLDFAREI